MRKLLSTYFIGIDFDNTIVSYSDIMYKTAVQWELVDSNTSRNKKEIRDKIRALPDGELKWQELQAFVYGKNIGQAHLIDGVKQFFEICKDRGIQTCIVSHKSKHATADRENIDLQDVARHWMRDNQFFDEQGFGLREDQVFLSRRVIKK